MADKQNKYLTKTLYFAQLMKINLTDNVSSKTQIAVPKSYK